MDVKPVSRASVRPGRLNAIVVAAGCFGVLGTASYLTPDPRGFGTHEQLGLPPCISSNYLGVPCPLCGMTTAFTLMAHARPIEALHAQPAGALLFVLCALVMAGASTAAIFGHTPRHAAALAQSSWIGMGIVALLAGAWVYKLIVYWR